MEFSKCDGFYNKYVKRIIDFIIGIFFFIVLLPIFFIISLLIIFESGFPVFYKAYRGGFNEKPFKIFKFRTMVKDADKIGGDTTALNDSRITKIGGFLRKTKLDEIPQLLNIIKGEMSFIGPRPEVLKYVERYEGDEKYILKVRPGITDFSSLEFISLDEIVGGDNADDVYEEKVLKKKNELRVKYASEVFFLTDIKLFLLTLLKTFEKICKVVGLKK